MQKLQKGEFFGNHYKKSAFEDCIITDTEYTHKKVDWHYHENPYFTYLLQGQLFEANKKEAYYLNAGSLLFHNWQDAHHNIKPDEYTRGFHVELNEEWFKRYELSSNRIEGSVKLPNPVIKGIFNKVFLESKVNDKFSQTSIDSLIIEVFNTIEQPNTSKSDKKPQWLAKLKEILIEDNLDLSLTELSLALNIHPVHLSRTFREHFGVSLGQYTRQLKLNKAILLISSNQFSMTEICYQCGFYDQSHFTKTFKSFYGYTPLEALKKIA
ncbi:MAG: AraC family transcriptional regulator [Bacteroidia bacterium]|jgi:AraC family transcriptional regulator